MGSSSAANTEAQAAQQANAGANAALQNMNPILSGLTGGYNLSGINSDVLGYLLNPSSTALSAATPYLTSFYTNEMNNGLSSSYTNAMRNQQQVSSQQSLNSLLNQMGPSTNIGAIANQWGLNSMMGQASLGSQLAAQNQAVEQQGAAGLASTAAASDAQKASMLESALGAATGESGTALNAYNSVFGQYNNAAENYTNQEAAYQQQAADQWSQMFGSILGLGASSLMGGAGLGAAFPSVSSSLTGSGSDTLTSLGGLGYYDSGLGSIVSPTGEIMPSAMSYVPGMSS